MVIICLIFQEYQMKTKINKTRKQGWITLIALVIIAFAIYIGFSPLFELIQGGIAGRVLG